MPTIITDTIINITTNSAMAKGSVTTDGGSPFVFSGICWDTAHNPTTADFHTLDGIGLCSISSNLLGLTMGQYYYVRAFATNSAGTAYGNELVFRTQTYPAVTTNAISNISVTTALSGGNVTDDGGATVTARGVCWSSTSTAPTIADSHTSDGTGTGIYSSVLSALARNTKYYVRAYATNYIGTSYGDTVSFTTLADFPTVTTAAVSSITSVTAVVGGEVTDDGDATVTTRGICYNTTGNPTIADNILPIGSGTGSFSSTLSGLTASTTYYIRAYATNISGTSYGLIGSFTTADPWTCGVSTITDYDNNVYNTVQIGTQCWMREYLRTTHYADGTSITITSNTSTSQPYMCYPNGDVNNVAAYAYLYNWCAAMRGNSSSSLNPSGIQGVCPTGWHLPSVAEWEDLVNIVSADNTYWCNSNSAYIAKSLASTSGWESDGGICTVGNAQNTNNSTGFDALPAGGCASVCGGFGQEARMWTSTENSSTSIYYYVLYYNSAEVQSGSATNYAFRSVRCLKD
ncbi:MAG: fibrobacter succinogenes major paralogous domain-containing protein [Bacteroidales bacterium]|nr:fibrobacter succinogenes major paralogous domain-containing protein [Bacteroidales bacterium]